MLRRVLESQYRLLVDDITFLPLGHDSRAAVYRVLATDAAGYFLKATKRPINPSSLLVPRYLYDHGVQSVIPPLRTSSDALWTVAQHYSLILYPYVEGRQGGNHGMAPGQWIEYGSVLRQIHDTALTADITQNMARETYVPATAELVRTLDALVGTEEFDEPLAQELVSFWREKRAEIRTLVNRAEMLGKRLAGEALELTLCHADIHTNNVLVDSDGKVWVVDWDETVLAPKERDLMFVVGGGISRRWVRPSDEVLFFEGYGATPINPLALAYYRYSWAISDIGEYAEQALLRPDLGDATRKESVESFESIFVPGNIADIAFSSELVP